MPGRPRWRAYLLLARISNLPTVWTNVVAGAVVSGAALEWPRAAALAGAVSLMYIAGMFLNDAFDHRFDAAARPERPLPAGDVSVSTAFSTGTTLLVAGEIWLGWIAREAEVLAWGAALAAAIVYYDYRHKRDPFGPLVMGLCRGLVYCVAAAAATGRVSAGVLTAAAIMTAYVTGLTLAAKRMSAGRRYLVPYLIAGISLLDAAVVATVAPWAAPWVAVGFLVTMAGQRIVPGD